MIRKIVLVSEVPESHDQLLRGLAAAGFQVVPQATLRAAVSVLFDAENTALALVLDGPAFSAADAEVLASLSVQHPKVRMMVFVSRGLQEETLDRLKGCRQVGIYNTTLGDKSLPAFILKVLTEAIAPTTSYETALTEAVAQGQSVRGLRGRSIRTPSRAHQSPGHR